MSIEYISREAKKIIHQYKTDDPESLCRHMNISLIFASMGSGSADCKGFYLIQSRKQVIVVNNDLPEKIQKIIIAHEIGHAVLHKKISKLKAFHDFALFDETSIFEYEANIFAADVLMNDSEVLDLLNDDISFFQAARRLDVPAELLDFKFRILKRKGYKVVDPPFVSNSNFLKNI
ncbi:ImmA/IrrE family metallo-endopeptidase [Alkalibacter mobilis]|uniref:ImmA/IrrE family metallo-endopeptidase n=1 Tax=Alkalibacter mobilis TaxID=2787712 RepID=UPI0018A095D4|nr:ImmA/IrrE family metallo-endopeptidase [Alkalibacter mobilis]MBF7097441.1 ImmA/IrrE family metallo-endopeptidase [Alkalibacter mobilis]